MRRLCIAPPSSNSLSDPSCSPHSSGSERELEGGSVPCEVGAVAARSAVSIARAMAWAGVRSAKRLNCPAGLRMRVWGGEGTCPTVTPLGEESATCSVIVSGERVRGDDSATQRCRSRSVMRGKGSGSSPSALTSLYRPDWSSEDPRAMSASDCSRARPRSPSSRYSAGVREAAAVASGSCGDSNSALSGGCRSPSLPKGVCATLPRMALGAGTPGSGAIECESAGASVRSSIGLVSGSDKEARMSTLADAGFFVSTRAGVSRCISWPAVVRLASSLLS